MSTKTINSGHRLRKGTMASIALILALGLAACGSGTTAGTVQSTSSSRQISPAGGPQLAACLKARGYHILDAGKPAHASDSALYGIPNEQDETDELGLWEGRNTLGAPYAEIAIFKSVAAAQTAVSRAPPTVTAGGPIHRAGEAVYRVGIDKAKISGDIQSCAGG
jgi:hypothetical protein